ncbi:50S ribosomal protein L22 [Egibacter rhizosphaerae]|uniref:Large ribosomal subunit protein uL22 n=1 Tax=Egibacter rhizosphaerae TaxID=1670831 RepID=A0A411YGY3_9ACTN|nr:50S ribosomal protein L22 [Egibacter rhizosphaerae]
MQAKATLRYARVAPPKVRQITRDLRGLGVEEARAVLDLETKGAARDVRKTLDSAAANAENNHELDPEDLVIERIVVEEGPVLRRFRPRAMGRATRIRKRTTHLTVVLTDGEDEEPAPSRGKGASKAAAAAATGAAAGEGEHESSQSDGDDAGSA